MHCWPGPGDRINSFALVSYIPDPLGTYLDQLRQELVPSCVAQSHVSILPPRVLASEHAAQSQLEIALRELPPFQLELSEVQVFRDTSVIYLSIGAGRNHLLRLHDSLNEKSLGFDEPFEYHPHITLAQNFPVTELDALEETARQGWAKFGGCREFTIDVLTFVQNTARNQWVDLRPFALGAAPVAALIQTS